MKEKLEILQRLIECRMFASSPAALAKVLGYKGKMTLYRLVEGKISSRTVDEVWERLQEIFETTDSDLSLLRDVCELSIFLQQEILSEIDRLEPKSVEQMIKSFIEEKYDYSERFDKEVVPFLKELRKDKPDHYWGMLLCLYLKIKKVDLYQKNFKQVWLNWLDDLGDIFFTLYPENIKAQGAIAGMKATILHESYIPSMWWLLYNGIVLCRVYTEQDYMRILAASSHLIDCPSFSYWIPFGAEYKEGERAWIWMQYDFDTGLRGYYFVYQIRAGNNIETFSVEKLYTFRFVEEYGQDYLQIVDLEKGTSDYKCEYDSDKYILHIIPFGETQEMLLPAFIRCINTSHSYGKDEKVWNRLLDKFMDGKGWEMLQEVAGAVDQTDIYEVEDVIISRKYLCLILTESGSPKKYQLPLTAYSFLTTITPMQEIWISRHVNDSEIYIEWPLLGYAIKLSDFTQIE